MRYGPEHKQQTRERILDAAARVFRREGFAGGGVGSVMEEAGLTHGGFYAHFSSKEDLFAEMVRRAVHDNRAQRTRGCEHLEGEAWVRAVVERYLSVQHRDATEEGCPAPPILSELARSSDGPRQAFSEAFSELEAEFADHLGDSSDEHKRSLALGVLAACVGGLAISRAVGDESQSLRVLESARQLIRRALDAEPERRPERSRGEFR